MKKIVVILTYFFAGSVFAIEPGTYSRNGSSDETLVLTPQKTITMVIHRQVGGASFSVYSTPLPFPTVCKYKQWGKIKSENSSELIFQVSHMLLLEASPEHQRNCEIFVGETNGEVSVGSLLYSVSLIEFKKVP